MLSKIASVLSRIIWLPGMVGVLGCILAAEKTETWIWRSVGAFIALLMSPFMLMTVFALLGNDILEKIRYYRCKVKQ